MGMLDIYEDLRRDAEVQGKEGAATKDIWIKAAAAALIIAARKTAKARAASWTREAVECMLHADPTKEEVLEDLLYYSPWRALEEVWDFFHDRYGDPYEIAPTS